MIYDYRLAALSSEDRALCDFAAKLTLRPAAMRKEDSVALCKHGFTDEQITIAVQVISYFNYINRVAEGLGVDPEAWMKPTAAEWRLSGHEQKYDDVRERRSAASKQEN